MHICYPSLLISPDGLCATHWNWLVEKSFPSVHHRKTKWSTLYEYVVMWARFCELSPKKFFIPHLCIINNWKYLSSKNRHVKMNTTDVFDSENLAVMMTQTFCSLIFCQTARRKLHNPVTGILGQNYQLILNKTLNAIRLGYTKTTTLV